MVSSACIRERNSRCSASVHVPAAAESITTNAGNTQAQPQQIDYRLVERRSPAALLAIESYGDLLGQIANRQMACIHIMHYTNASVGSRRRAYDRLRPVHGRPTVSGADTALGNVYNPSVEVRCGSQLSN